MTHSREISLYILFKINFQKHLWILEENIVQRDSERIRPQIIMRHELTDLVTKVKIY